MNFPAAQTPNFLPSEFRQALGIFATGVTIITARANDGTLIGLTASSFNSVSLDPPLVLWSLGLRARNLEQFKQCSHYAVNILSSEQSDLAMSFAKSEGNRFEGVDYLSSQCGAPLITGCLANFECFNRSRYLEGDHIIFVGQVERFRSVAGEPLIYQNGRFALIADSSKASSKASG